MSLRAKTGNRIVMGFEFRRDGLLTARGAQTVACMRRNGPGVVPTDIPAELTAALQPFS